MDPNKLTSSRSASPTPFASTWRKRRSTPTYGARPLKRLLEREVQDVLAVKLLEGEIAKGDEVEVDAEGGGLSFGVRRT